MSTINEKFAMTGEQVLDDAYASRDGWTSFKAIYDGDEAETWSVVGERYVDLDRAGGYYSDVVLFRDLDQSSAHDAVAYLNEKRAS